MGISLSILHSKELKRIVFFERKLGKKIERKPVPTGKQVCENQLFHLVDRMESVKTDEQITSFLPAIYAKLENMSKEDIIKNFVALEFNQLLEHYKGSEDINYSDRDDRGERGYKVERGERTERERGERKPYDDKREGRENREPREGGERKKRGSSEAGFARMYINVGKIQKVNPGRIIELLNSVKSLRDARVGKILIEENYTAFDIEAGFEEELINGFRSKQISGVPVTITQEVPAGGKREFKKEGGPKSYGREGKPYDKAIVYGGSDDKKKKKKW
jgi:ATP-dependent RNA helicase DeaD